VRFIGKLDGVCIYDEKQTVGECQDFEFHAGRSDGYGEFTFIYGPSAGGLTESIQFKIRTSGEQILEIYAEPTFKKRFLSLSGDLRDVSLTVERINAMFSASHSVAFLLALERSMDVQADYETNLSRVIELELERIRNHVYVLHKLAETGALGVASYQLQVMQEKTNRLIGEACGHRYFFGVNYLNYVDCDFQGLDLNYLNGFSQFFRDMVENRILIDRFQNNGKIDQDWLIGPAARATGRKYDARCGSTLPYKDLGFSPITENSPDAFGRFLVRGEEILQSADMIREALRRWRKVESRKRDEALSGEGEGISLVESPSGDMVYKVRNYNGRVDVSFLPPSKANLVFFLKSAIGTIFTDFPFNWESFGIWVSEIGVEKK